MAWLGNIGGRLKSDYRYSIGLVYNPFPWPNLAPKAETEITELANGVLAARAAHVGDTLAALYDPETMPPDPREAHEKLDARVDRLYRRDAFGSDQERVEHLLSLYEKCMAPLISQPTSLKRRGRKRAAV